MNDEKIKAYLREGCEVKGLGRGHIRRLKDEVWQEWVTARASACAET